MGQAVAEADVVVVLPSPGRRADRGHRITCLSRVHAIRPGSRRRSWRYAGRKGGARRRISSFAAICAIGDNLYSRATSISDFMSGKAPRAAQLASALSFAGVLFRSALRSVRSARRRQKETVATRRLRALPSPPRELWLFSEGAQGRDAFDDPLNSLGVSGKQPFSAARRTAAVRRRDSIGTVLAPFAGLAASMRTTCRTNARRRRASEFGDEARAEPISAACANAAANT